MRFAEIYHWLDGEQHSGTERAPFTGLAIMEDVRPVMEDLPQTMAAEIAYHATALPFGIGLNGRTNIAGCCAGLNRCHAAHQRIIRNLDQTRCGTGNFLYRIHAA